MPKLKKSPVEQRDNLIIAKINYYAELQGVAIDRLANAARISVKTMYTRRKNPGQFSVDEWMGYATIYISQLQNYFSDKSIRRKTNDRRNKNHPKKWRTAFNQRL